MLSNPSRWFFCPTRSKKNMRFASQIGSSPQINRGENSKNLVVDQPPPSFDESFGCFQKLVGFPQIIHGLIGFSLIFTIHFGVPVPLFLVQHPFVSRLVFQPAEQPGLFR